MSLKLLEGNLSHFRRISIESILDQLRSDNIIDEDEQERICAQKSDSAKADMLIMDIIVSENRVDGFASIIRGLERAKYDSLACRLKQGFYDTEVRLQKNWSEVDVKYQRIFEYARDELIPDGFCLIEPTIIIEHLKAAKLISLHEGQIITGEITKADQTRKLVDYLWKRASQNTYKTFQESLEKQNYVRAINALDMCKTKADKEYS